MFFKDESVFYQLKNQRGERIKIFKCPVGEKCPYSGVFLVHIFPHSDLTHGEIRITSPYSARMGENTGQKNSEYGHFSRSGLFKKMSLILTSTIIKT